ncbi:MAG: hypothetical protein AAGA72_03015 [Pseudomonadota bacterium]
MRTNIALSGLVLSLVSYPTAFAQDLAENIGDVCDDICQQTRDTQNPTASIRGFLLDTTIGFGPDDDNTFYNYQLQPVATVAEAPWGSVIVRGIIPLLGVPQPTGNGLDDFDTEYGLADTTLQAVYVPPNQRRFSFGFGPQISIETHTEDFTQSAGWGAGLAGGGFGAYGPLAIGGLVNHLWGEDDYSVSTVQPIVFYNFPESPIGPFSIGYNGRIIYDWNSEEWTVPVGAIVGKTFVRPTGGSFSANVGAFHLAESPTGGNDWQLKVTLISLF